MNKIILHRVFICLVIFSAFTVTNVFAANIRYIDSTAKGSANGTSWGNAWTSFSQISGLSAGDTVYISGGPSGSSKTYSVSTVAPIGGQDGKPITYKIGQETGHNGLAIFKAPNDFVKTGNVIVSGDAGDGKRHFEFSGGTRPVNISRKSDIRVSYVDCGTRAYGFYCYEGRGIEIDHIRIVKTNTSGTDDFIAFMEVRGDGWGSNSFHHNDVWIPRSNKSAGIGDDGIKGAAWSLDIYNNSFIGYKTTYGDNQHMDAIHHTAGGRIRIYNNTFKDMANYGPYLEAIFGGFSYVRIYNNLITFTDKNITASAPPKGIVVTGKSPGKQIKDVWVFNNTVADVGNHNCIWFNNSKGDATFANSGFYNNVCVNGGGNSIHPNVDTEANKSISSGNAPATFVSYKPNSADNDYRLKSTDSVLKDQGCSNCGGNKADLKSVTTKDRAGITQDGAWDIGAFDFNTILSRDTPSSEAPPSDSTTTDEISLQLPDPPTQLKILAN